MKSKFLFSLIFLASLVSCSSDSSNSDPGSSSGSGNGNGTNEVELKCEIAPTSMVADNSITIKYNNGSAPTIDNAYADSVKIEIDGEHIVAEIITDTEAKKEDAKREYNFIISGATSNGSLKINGDSRMGLYLNGTSITNPGGPAINIQNNKKISVRLGGENHLSDGPGWTPETSTKATFFSEGTLIFTGGGLLEVKGKSSHAIVSDGHFEIMNGCITIPEAERDGLHVNDSVRISGGTINIKSKGDAIQSERMSVKISDGKMAVKTSGIKSHGIVSAGTITIERNPEIHISVSGNGSKGLNSTGHTKITGGTINISASGGRHIEDIDNILKDTSNAAGMKVDQTLSLEGGELTIKSLGSKAKGINVKGNMNMSGGKIAIEADDDGIKVDGALNITGGSGSVTSRSKLAIDCGSPKPCPEGSLQLRDPGRF